MTRSIQRRLVLLAALIFLATWISAAQISNTQGFRNTQAILEREVARRAELLLGAGITDFARHETLETDPTHFIGVWRDGALLLSFGPDLLHDPTGMASFTRLIDGQSWVFAERCADRRCVVSGAAHERRHQNLYCLAASIFGPLSLILVAGFAGMLGAIHHALRPLKGLADSVAQIDLERPTALQIDKPMAEFAPLIAAINGLGGRVRKLLDRERMFLGSCAHEIRTPLTGLIGQLQINQQPGLENVRACAERTARVADQFLTFAASKSLHSSTQKTERFDLCETLRETIVPLLEGAPEVEFEMTGLDYLEVKAHPFAISTIANNLVQNALKYARSDGVLRLSVSVRARHGLATITVSDNGPGIMPKDRGAACEEFARFGARSDTSGAGLGLSIVREIVAQYHGTLSLHQCGMLGGQGVKVTLPVCQRDAQPQQRTQRMERRSELASPAWHQMI